MLFKVLVLVNVKSLHEYWFYVLLTVEASLKILDIGIRVKKWYCSCLIFSSGIREECNT